METIVVLQLTMISKRVTEIQSIFTEHCWEKTVGLSRLPASVPQHTKQYHCTGGKPRRTPECVQV